MRWIKTIWLELTSKVRVYAQIAAGPISTAIGCWIIHIVAQSRWDQPTQQLRILEVFGVIYALTNAVVVIALSQVHVNAGGPGGTHFNVGTDDEDAAVPPAVVTTTRTELVPAQPAAAAATDEGELPPDKRVKL